MLQNVGPRSYRGSRPRLDSSDSQPQTLPQRCPSSCASQGEVTCLCRSGVSPDLPTADQMFGIDRQRACTYEGQFLVCDARQLSGAQFLCSCAGTQNTFPQMEQISSGRGLRWLPGWRTNFLCSLSSCVTWPPCPLSQFSPSHFEIIPTPTNGTEINFLIVYSRQSFAEQ